MSTTKVTQNMFTGSSVGPWTSYSPVLGTGFGTTTGSSFFWRLITDTGGGLEVEIKGVFKTGTIDSNPGTVKLPNSYTADASRIPLFGNRGIVGEAHCTSATGGNGIWAVQQGQVCIVDSSDYTVLFFANQESTDAASTVTNICVGNTATNNGSKLTVHAVVPVT